MAGIWTLDLPDLSDSEGEWIEVAHTIQGTQLHPIWRYPLLLDHLLKLDCWKSENGESMQEADRTAFLDVMKKNPWNLPMVKINERKVSIKILMI